MASVASSLDLPVLPVQEFAVPEGINPDAWAAFDEMIEACGRTVFRMPSSCDMYLRQYLSQFPKERELLSQALQQGVPDRILQESNGGKIVAVLDQITRQFVKAANLNAAEGKWAVEAWATALGRPVDYIRPSEQIVELTTAPLITVSDKSLRTIMALIAGAGGALGGMTAYGLGFLVVYLTDPFADVKLNGKDAANVRVALGVLVLIFMAMGGFAGGVSAFCGWLFGRGNERPWGGFAAAFGAAFGAGIIGFFVRGPGIVTCFAIVFCTFGATFTVATRGGRRD